MGEGTGGKDQKARAKRGQHPCDPSVQKVCREVPPRNGEVEGESGPSQQIATQKLYKAKAGGQWAICNNLGSRQAAPLTALKRDQAGPKGQPKGTTATSPKEVDSIIRRIYGKIYKGNSSNAERQAGKNKCAER